MGNAFSHRQLEVNKPAMEGVTNLENYGQNIGLGKAGKADKQIIASMMGGDYSGLAGNLLSPIHDQYATEGREQERNALMGGNALAFGNQPALMAGLQNESRAKMAEGEGLAYGQAIPALFGQAQQGYQNALNAQTGSQMQALQGGLQGRLGANQYVTQPGWMDRLGQTVGIAGQIGQLAMGIPGLGGPSAGGGPYGASQGTSGSHPYGYPCWIAGELYGEGSLEQLAIRHYLLSNKALWARTFTAAYKAIGQWWVKVIQRHELLRFGTGILFDRLLIASRLREKEA